VVVAGSSFITGASLSPNSKAHDRERGLSKQVFSVKDLQHCRGQCEAGIFQLYMVHQASHSGSQRIKDNGWELSPTCIFYITGCHRVACFDQPCSYLNTGLSLSVVRREPPLMLSQGPQEKANKDVIASILSYFQFQRGKNVSAIEKITPVFPVGFIFQACVCRQSSKSWRCLSACAYHSTDGNTSTNAHHSWWGDQLALKVELQI
jgi:hypothetical protein